MGKSNATRRHETYVRGHWTAIGELTPIERLAYMAAADVIRNEARGRMLHEALVAGGSRIEVRESAGLTLEEVRQEWLEFIEQCVTVGGLPPVEDIGEVASALWCEREVLDLFGWADRVLPERVVRWAAERRAFVLAWDERHVDTIEGLTTMTAPEAE